MSNIQSAGLISRHLRGTLSLGLGSWTAGRFEVPPAMSVSEHGLGLAQRDPTQVFRNGKRSGVRCLGNRVS